MAEVTTVAPHDRFIDAAHKALRIHLDRALENEPGTRLGEDPEALHDMRTSVRRMRAALRTFKHALPPRRRAWLKRELQWLGTALGHVRDLDVYLTYLRGILPRLAAPLRDGAAAYERMLVAEREKARRTMLRALDSKRYARFMARLRAFLDADPPKAPSASRARERAIVPARRVILKRLKQVLKDGRAMGADSTDAEIHELRKDCKRLRYSVEFFRDLLGDTGERFEVRMKKLQDTLGEHQDAVVGLRILRWHMEKAHAEADLAWNHLLTRHEERCRKTRDRVFAAWERFDRKKVRSPLKRELKSLARQT